MRALYSRSIKFSRKRPYKNNYGNFGKVRRLSGDQSFKADQEILQEWPVRARRNRFYVVSCVEDLYILREENLLNMGK